MITYIYIGRGKAHEQQKKEDFCDGAKYTEND